MEVHSSEIYTNPKWPTKPLFYTCVPSKTDDSVAPKGKENLFILIPIASDLKDDALTHSKYFDYVIDLFYNYLISPSWYSQVIQRVLNDT